MKSLAMECLVVVILLMAALVQTSVEVVYNRASGISKMWRIVGGSG